MAARLKAFVDVVAEDGTTRWFGPDDEVPAWAAEQITNPSAWGDDVPPAAETPTELEPPQPEATPEPEPEEPQGEPSTAEPVDDEGPPPRGGAGSGRDAWAAYASKHGFDVADEAGRDDIIATLAEAGIDVGEES